MCGIVAHVGAPSPEPATDPMYIVNATNALQHRGPDYVGFAVLGPTLLGHTRLAIVDPITMTQKRKQKLCN